MKTYTIKTLLSLACSILLITSPLRAQSSQVHYNNPEHTSGYLTLSAADCTDPWWEYDWEITTPTNAPIKVTVTLNYNDYLDVYTYDGSGIYQSIFLDETPGTTTKTVISSDGKIYVYCYDYCGTVPTFDVFTITFEVDSTIYSATDNLHVPGNLSVASNLDVLGNTTIVGNTAIAGNTTIAGNTRINNRLGVGANPYGSKVSISNYNQDDRAVSISSSKNTSSALYGLYSYASNGTGNVYGIYSSVSGVTGKKWAGYFDGGDVQIKGGKLGIGNIVPLGVLHVRGTYEDAWIYFASNAGMNTTKYKPKVNYGLAFTWNYSAGEGESIINYSTGGSSSPRLDFTSFDGTDLRTEMTLKQGFLGIGTTRPAEKLTIAGGHGDTRIRLSSTGNSGGQPANLSLWAGESEQFYYGTGIGYNVKGSPNYGRIDSIKGSSYVRFLPEETKFQFQTASGVDVDAVTIRNNGKVGVGTTQIPDSFKLAVAGKILAEEVVVELQENWPDYVFKTGYELMPLHQVEKFVHTNQHLPGIPSASRVKDKGLSIGEMQHLLLRKIEELTLYIIEQDKKIKSLEEKLK